MLGQIPEYLHLWYGKTRDTTYELRVTIYELRVESLKARVDSLKPRVKSQKCEFKYTSHEFKSTSYEFKFTSYDFKFTSSRIIKSMKTQVNCLQFFTRNYKNKKWRYQFCVTKGILNKHLWKNFFYKNRMPVFVWRF